ncbi:uncharacterized protein N0V89_004236 [Didymosphaeria variabile]|uniref:MFS transporter n=1 Tax=Didymosphaeria variabile TaxID=1932322 RepID=A0A9W8XQS8_9PLEO|nr:uncharacterized protein N0V89_004236 [Didymosphaeria variabile]KAJ4356206.1 hypothetical protein N0V89_004236 [Didymosphaeria variabile]
MATLEKPGIAEQLEHGHKTVTAEGGEVNDDVMDVHDEKANKQLNRKLDMRIIPLCCWIYLLNFLDRGNIGNSKVLNAETNDDLLQQTGMGNGGYALTVTLFSIAYAFFEVPSNWIMKHWVRPSLWLGFLLAAWGVLTIGFAGVQDFATVVVLRFLIGMFEAGFFPGIVYLITIWYRYDERAVRIALVIAFCNLSGAFGGAIAYGVGHINGTAGLEGFRWLFIIEGIITVLSAFLVWFFLPDYPTRARWLSPIEKQLSVDRVALRGGGYQQTHASRREILETCFHPRMLLHYLAYIADVVPQGSFTFFTPTIVTGLGYTSIHAQLLTVPPWCVGFVVAITASYSADHFNARGWHIAILSTLGGVGWLTAGFLPADAYVSRYGCLCLAAVGAFPAAPSLTNWVTCNTPSLLTIPLAIALHNSCAGLGQIIAQWIWRPSEVKQGYPTGNFMCASFSFLVAAIAIFLRLWYGSMNGKGKLDAGLVERVWAY